MISTTSRNHELWTVKSIYSCVDDEMVREFCERYCTPDSLNPTTPPDDETDPSHPEMVVIYFQSFSFTNFRYPLSSFLEILLEHYELHFSYVHPLGFLRAI